MMLVGRLHAFISMQDRVGRPARMTQPSIPPRVFGRTGMTPSALLRLLLMFCCYGLRWRARVHACACDVKFYQVSGFGNTACATPNVDFGCYPDEDVMWIKPPCGSLFRCNANHHDTGRDPDAQRGAFVRCGSRYFKPEKGQTRLNCSCTPASPQQPKHFGAHKEQHAGCGEHLSIDPLGGVSAAFRRLPMPAGANPAVTCCRHRQTSKGPITPNTLNFTNKGFAAWPAACEALCDAEPSGRCRYFTHSIRYQMCSLCAACEPEIALGDDTFASFQRVSEDPSTLYTGILA